LSPIQPGQQWREAKAPSRKKKQQKTKRAWPLDFFGLGISGGACKRF